jgi:hypothetical protein
VRIPKGSYTVEATFDTGPLAGVVKSSKDMSFSGEEVSQ